MAKQQSLKPSFDEYIASARNMTDENPRVLRFGQCLFNILADLRPDLSEQIRGTNLDPFYRTETDAALYRFIGWAKENW